MTDSHRKSSEEHTDSSAVPGLCECGCGGKTTICDRNHAKYGYVIGKPKRFIRGHATRGFKMSPEHREAFTQSRKGKKNSSEHRRKISEAQMGEKSPKWRGGRIIREGRVLIYVGREHPLADSYGYVYEHRLVAKPVRNLKQVVHHRDLNPMNNDPKNLLVLTRGKHTQLHNLLREGKTPEEAEAIVLGL